MIPLLTAAQMQAMDAHTIETVGLPGAVLMETAGRGVFRHLWERFPAARCGPVAVVCGRGNNGGDGFVVARCLHGRGVPVTVHLVGTREGVAAGGDARLHLEAYRNAGGVVKEVPDGALALGEPALVVDAVFGTGLTREVAGPAAAALDAVDACSAPVVSVDLPSGVCADTGAVRGRAVTAELTVTFAYPKRGHYLHPGAGYCGAVRVVDIGIPAAILNRVPADLFLWQDGDFPALPRLAADAHKGTRGHVVVVGGSRGKAGAPGLAAWAALRTGAGLATVAWPGGVAGENRLPLEVMTLPLGTGAAWDPAAWPALAALLGRAGAAVVGPGMGTGDGAGRVLEALLETPGAPAVLDADALNLLAAAPDLAAAARRPLVLTPHPGEAARLLGTDAGAVQADRPGAAAELARRYRAVAVLKGAGTLVAAPGDAACLLAVGNPGLATAGSGDVLAGAVGALLAGGLAPADAARAGVALHGAAGDRAAARRGLRGVVAGEVAEEIPAALADLDDRRTQTGPPGAEEAP